MDRGALEAWLRYRTRTFRWNHPEDPNGYDAVEVGPRGLRWYRWSHRFGEDGVHGEYDVHHQTLEEFGREGPARGLPAGVQNELEAYLRHAESPLTPGSTAAK